MNTRKKYKTRTAGALLDSGERLFGVRLYSDVSLEEICANAGCNIGQFTYHFHNKHNFLKACILRRAPQLCEERRILLENYIQLVGVENVQLEPLLRAFIDPFISKAMGGDPGWRNYARFLATIVWWENAAEVISLGFDAAAKPYLESFQIALEGMNEDKAARCFQFMLACLYNSVVEDKRLEILTEGRSRSENLGSYYKILIPFLVAGFTRISKIE